MKTFLVRNTNDAMYPVYSWLGAYGEREPSRNGVVLTAPEPVAITYTHPLECVNLCPTRDANPFFHLAEAVWMIAGRQDIRPLTNILPSFKKFSDNGITQNAAYGYRAVRHFGNDQIKEVVNLLLRDAHTRQAVIQMWDPSDLGKNTVDKACNMSLVFRFNCRKDQLDMTIFNRSNDAVWGGVSGANVVHMAFFLEVVAAGANMFPGSITAVSNNLHVYLELQKAVDLLEKYNSYHPENEWYERRTVEPQPLAPEYPDPDVLRKECNAVINWTLTGCRGALPIIDNRFLVTTFMPMMEIFHLWGSGKRHLAKQQVNRIAATDWRAACKGWMERRKVNAVA